MSLSNTAIQKKILLTVPALQGRGGVASFCSSILPYLSTDDYDVIPLEIGSSRDNRNLLHPFADQLRFMRTLAISPSLVHINPSLGFKSFVRDGLFVWQTKRRGLPVLVFWHGWNKRFEPVLQKHLLHFFHKTFGQADCFVVLALEFKRKLRKWGITAPVHIGTTAVAEDLLQSFNPRDRFHEARKSGRTKILFLARLERAKGIFETIDAVRLLLEKGISVSLSIAGDGPVRQELEAYVAELKLQEEQIRFLGFVRGSDKAGAFIEHDIYCFPTFYGEGLPTSVLEAMAFGMPVITRPVGGLADMFQDGRMGIFVQGKDSEEIAAALERIISDKTLMVKMSRFNSAHAREHFMASKVAEKLRGFYHATLNGVANSKS